MSHEALREFSNNWLREVVGMGILVEFAGHNVHEIVKLQIYTFKI
jgi:hypothetical protein